MASQSKPDAAKQAETMILPPPFFRDSSCTRVVFYISFWGTVSLTKRNKNNRNCKKDCNRRPFLLTEILSCNNSP